MIVDPFDILCGERNGFCHAGKGNRSKHWEVSHLTRRAIMSTYPLSKSAIAQILKLPAHKTAAAVVTPDAAPLTKTAVSSSPLEKWPPHPHAGSTW